MANQTFAIMELNRFSRPAGVYADNEYISGLKSGDPEIIRSFFYLLCSYTLNDIRRSLMQGRVKYDELVSELYIYLSADNWRKLDTFAGRNDCSLRSWMVRLAWRFFMQQRGRILFDGCPDVYERSDGRAETVDMLDHEIAMDVELTFDNMPNKRYVSVLRWMLVDGYDASDIAGFLSTTVSNIYNIKHRAIVQFIETFNS